MTFRLDGALILLAALLLSPDAATAWENKKTHPSLTDAAVSHTAELDWVLREVYGLEEGLGTELAVQEGFAEERGISGLDKDITGGFFGFSRLSRDKSVASLDLPFLFTNVFVTPPDDVRIVVNDRCKPNAGFARCAEGLERAEVEDLLRAGVFAEDNPNIRASHHFHDPLRRHDDPSPVLPGAPEVPSGNRGLDNTSDVWLRQFAQEGAIDVVTRVFRGGGTFRLIGRSAKDRALNRPEDEPASQAEPRNFFSLVDAERYLHLGLTAPQADEREHWMALHFIAVGSVLHLLEDMGSVAHVRNDFLNDHLWALIPGIGPNLEAQGEKDPLVEFIDENLQPEDADLATSLPARALSNVGLPAGAYLERLPLLTAEQVGTFEFADFWDKRSVGDGGDGLAALVNRSFFSRATVDARIDPNDLEGSPETAYPSPDVPRGSRVDGEPPPAIGVSVLPLPRRDLLTGEIVETQAEEGPCFLSSRLVPHLARCRFHRQVREGATVLERDLDEPFTVIDDSVQRDYLEILFPLTINYTARFMERYFAPRLALLQEGSRRFRLANRTRLPMRFHRDAIEVVYDTTRVDEESGQRIRMRAPVSCDETGDSVLELAPAGEGEGRGAASDFTCHIPETLPEAPQDPSSFWVLLHGRLGERGRAEPSPPSGLPPEDPVVAFVRVFPEIVFDRLVKPLASSDAVQQVDLYSAETELGEEVAPEDPPAETVNLTAPLREALARPDIDFVGPFRRPGSRELALWSDRDAPADQEFPLFVTGTLMDLFRLDRSLPRDDPSRLEPVPNSRFSFLTNQTPYWSIDGSALTFPTVERGKDELAFWDVETGESRAITTPGAFAVVEETADSLVFERCGDDGALDAVNNAIPIGPGRALVEMGCSRFERFEDSGEISFQGAGVSQFLADVVSTAEGGLELLVTHSVGAGADAGLETCDPSASLPFEDTLQSECPPGMSETVETTAQVAQLADGTVRAVFLSRNGGSRLVERDRICELLPFPQQDFVLADLTGPQLDTGTVVTIVPDVGEGVFPRTWTLEPEGAGLVYAWRPKRFPEECEGRLPSLRTLFQVDLRAPVAPPVTPRRVANKVDVLRRLTWGSVLRLPAGP